VTALYERERTGRGRVVDVAMIDTIYPVLTSNLTGYYRTGAAPRAGNGHGGAPLVPYNVYPCAGDGYVAIIVVTETHWRSLCGAMARPELADDERFSSNAMRFRNLEELDRLVADWARSLDRDEIVARLRAARIPCAAVRDVGEMVEDRHLHERGAIQRIDHPTAGEVVVPHSPLRFRGTPLAPLTASPDLGASNREVFGEWLGLADAELAALAADGVI